MGLGLVGSPPGPPRITQCHIFFPQIPDPTPRCHPHHSTPHLQLSTFTSVCTPLPQQLRPHSDQGDRVRRTVGKYGSRAGRKTDRKESRERLRARETQHTFKRRSHEDREREATPRHTEQQTTYTQPEHPSLEIEAIDHRAADPRVTPIRQTVKQVKHPLC